MMSLVVTKSNGVAKSSLLRPSRIARRQPEGALKIETVGPIVETVKGGLRRRLGAVHRVTLHLAIGKPQGEGGVGIGASSIDRETRFAESLAGALVHALDVILHPFDDTRGASDRACAPARSRDPWTLRPLPRRLRSAAFAPPGSSRCVPFTRAVAASCGVLPSEHDFDERIGRADLLQIQFQRAR